MSLLDQAHLKKPLNQQLKEIFKNQAWNVMVKGIGEGYGLTPTEELEECVRIGVQRISIYCLMSIWKSTSYERNLMNLYIFLVEKTKFPGMTNK